MGVIYGLVLIVLFAAPAAASLSVSTYPSLSLARFLAFLATVIIYVAYGRHLTVHQRTYLIRGLILGAASAFLGTLVYQYVIRLPMAESALVSSLPGVPAKAALIMLHLHEKTGTLLSAAVSAGLNGLLGGAVTWWAGTRHPTAPAPEPDEGHGDSAASGF